MLNKLCYHIISSSKNQCLGVMNDKMGIVFFRVIFIVSHL